MLDYHQSYIAYIQSMHRITLSLLGNKELSLRNDVLHTTKENPLEGAPEFKGHCRVKDRIDGTVVRKIVKEYRKN